MRVSQQFSKTFRTAPQDEVSVNAALLLRAGFIDKTMSGVFTLLPMGLRVLENINRVIREEIDAIGAEEILMPALQPKENWETTSRWDHFDALYRVHSTDGSHEFALGPTHEEIVTPLAKKFIQSYRDLPRAVYQIQTKFRFEPRAKSGLLRGREFWMKDLYSFHLTDEDLAEYYAKTVVAYQKIFARLGLDALRVRASGGAFSKFSEEFQVLAASGEDEIFHCACGWAENKEIATVAAGDPCPQCGQPIKVDQGIEVGNIFTLNTRFSEPFGLTVTDEASKEQPVIMGCYGIGSSRLLGTLVEVYHDGAGIIWPENVAPYQFHLLCVGNDAATKAVVEDIYSNLRVKGISVLFDDREGVSAGEKFADADLIGLPRRIVVSAKTVAKAAVEIKKRAASEAQVLSISAFLDQPYV